MEPEGLLLRMLLHSEKIKSNFLLKHAIMYHIAHMKSVAVYFLPFVFDTLSQPVIILHTLEASNFLQYKAQVSKRAL